MPVRPFASALAGLVLVTAAACGSSGAAKASRPASTSTRARTDTTLAPTTSTSVTLPQSSTTLAPVTTTTGPPTVPGFAGTVATITAADVPSTYHAGCPVGPDQLRMLHMSYWGFDGQPHTGAMVVNASVTQSVLDVFARLYGDRFPIRRMVPEDAYGGSDPASMAADNTSGFNCRNAVATGPPHWSAHAYGEAIDVNTVENPYVEGGTVQPAAGSAFLDRSVHRAGMAYWGGELVNAFAAVGWSWGGRWSTPDYQHFSSTGG